MNKSNQLDLLDMYENYGCFVCKVGKAMDDAGISISKMRKLTGLNHEIVKKYYEDKIIRIDKDVLSRISYILMLHGVDPNTLVEYIPPKKDDIKSNPTLRRRED